MKLFVQDDNIEMIGVGASKRSANEWFEGPARIREIDESDCLYWGDVKLDVEGAKITVQGMRHGFPQWEPLHRPKSSIPPSNSNLNDMKDIFDRNELSADEKLMEATHYGMRRRARTVKGDWAQLAFHIYRSADKRRKRLAFPYNSLGHAGGLKLYKGPHHEYHISQL